MAARSADPTRTKSLRSRYARTLRGGFSRINTVIREAVVERDIFGLGEDGQLIADVMPPRDFRFDRDDQKVEGFVTWLEQAQADEVLEIIGQNDNQYVRSAYERGIKNAHRNLREEGIDIPVDELDRLFNQPVHRDKLQLLYTRNYRALNGITDDVAKEVSRELTQGLAEGTNPRVTARRITDRVDSIGKTRATTMARTETIHAHAEGALDRYESTGVSEVVGQAEFLTAGDDRVCDICAALDGNRYSIEEARGKIPQHPNCRCTFKPLVTG